MNNMEQQTAVEWLTEKLMKGEFINSPEELIIQAKHIEKTQINDAYANGQNDRLKNRIRDYYDDQYNNK